MTPHKIWYVAYRPEKTERSTGSTPRRGRSTKTFETEIDAKQFAMQMLAEGWLVTAGTLNPYTPKQIIDPSRIEHWAAQTSTE